MLDFAESRESNELLEKLPSSTDVSIDNNTLFRLVHLLLHFCGYHMNFQLLKMHCAKFMRPLILIAFTHHLNSNFCLDHIGECLMITLRMQNLITFVRNHY
jgi:hypothetical protein